MALVSIDEDDPEFLERLGKLPLWVQEYQARLVSEIRLLEKQVEALTENLNAGPEDSDVFAEIDNTERPLGKGVEIRFEVGDDQYMVVLEDGALKVTGSGTLLIEPEQDYEVLLHLKGKT